MDLKDPANKTELQNQISNMLSSYQKLFTKLTNNPETYKKSALLYYWLRDYKNYIKNESTFDPKYYPQLYRGSIVNLNLGFNIGSEIGGLHYAIVLQNSNRNNPNITVVPLTSLKPGKDINHLRPTEVFLGQELYFKIQGKYEALKLSIPNELTLLETAIRKGQSDPLHPQTTGLYAQVEDMRHKVDLLSKTIKKLQSLKTGSIAVMNQIRTVSKIRIVDPTDQYDILYNLKLSSSNLDLVDHKSIELFTHKT